ncbi:early light-induced protein 1, chloroplastic-like [Euphorbia lathyris]|uniref:early light-induced protein 1, chloroplastic-like n=1 Tax=Euphorbia lathyris TaxID=212925 RepID=UPI003313FA13
MAGATSAILSSPVMRTVSNRGTVSQFRAAPCRPRIVRFSNISVRCMAEGDQVEKQKPLESVSTPPTLKSTPSPSPTPAPKPKAKMSTKFSDILAFSGPAPERINGRLAMIGFVAALAVELSSGHDLFSQVSDGGVTWFIGSSVLLSLASLIPLFKGVSVESKSDGIMTSDAELWNGRLAMLGLVALAFTEYVKGGAFI